MEEIKKKSQVILEVGGFVLAEQVHLKQLCQPAKRVLVEISYRALHFCCPVCYFYSEFHKDTAGMLASDLKMGGIVYSKFLQNYD